MASTRRSNEHWIVPRGASVFYHRVNKVDSANRICLEAVCNFRQKARFVVLFSDAIFGGFPSRARPQKLQRRHANCSDFSCR